VKTGSEVLEKGPNFYAILGVTRSSTAIEIKKAYKRLSLQLHPDKNPSPTAADEFATVKGAYDVLMSVDDKIVYDKFGPAGIAGNKSIHDEQALLMDMGIFYATWCMLAFILTLGKSAANARTWIFTGTIVMLIAEITLMTTENPLPEWFFPQTTEAEWIWLLHSLFPGFMNGCRCMGGYLYVDLDQQTRNLLLALQEQNKDVLMVLRDVQIGVSNLTAGRGPVTATGADGVTTTTAMPAQQMNSTVRATPTGKLKELEVRLKQSNANVANSVAALKTEGSKGSGMGFYLMIAGYIAVQFFFNQ